MKTALTLNTWAVKDSLVLNGETHTPIGYDYSDIPNRIEDAFYAWFPIKGDSMTNFEDAESSIPDGSMVLGRELECKDILDIPVNKPLLISGTTDQGKHFNICKTATCLNGISGHIKLTGYNKEYKECWMPLRFIDKIFIVEQVRQTLNYTPIQL